MNKEPQIVAQVLLPATRRAWHHCTGVRELRTGSTRQYKTTLGCRTGQGKTIHIVRSFPAVL